MIQPKAALWWDESFLWGIVLYNALKANSLPFELISSKEILTGALNKYKLLIVPGGWASNKLKTIGKHGYAQIQSFVQKGGAYVGICGGAGAATLDGIGLLKIKRMPTSSRAPSLSGEVFLKFNNDAIWDGVQSNKFYIWWPSQFLLTDKHITVMAEYEAVGDDFYSSDLKASFVNSYSNWRHFEEYYNINLNPKKIIGEPAVVYGNYGKGEVILSLVHFDTPGDINGAAVLKNLWDRYGIGNANLPLQHVQAQPLKTTAIVSEIKQITEGLIQFAKQNFLFFRRNDFVYHWRRGIRGLEYNTLLVMITTLANLCEMYSVKHQQQKLSNILDMLTHFAIKAKRLLFMQRQYIQQPSINNADMLALHKELFGEAKSHGGSFKTLIDCVDSILYEILLIDNNQSQW